MKWTLAIMVMMTGCSDPQPRFGDPGVGESLVLPGAEGLGRGEGQKLFGNRPFDPANPPAPLDTGANIHLQRANIAIDANTVCMGCHGVGNAGATSKWAYAGIAFAKGTTPLAEGEVVVADGTTTIGPVKSAVDGFFWIPIEAGVIDAGRTAIRDADGGYSEMRSGLAGNGNCSGAGGCHTGTAGKIDFQP